MFEVFPPFSLNSRIIRNELRMRDWYYLMLQKNVVIKRWIFLHPNRLLSKVVPPKQNNMFTQTVIIEWSSSHRIHVDMFISCVHRAMCLLHAYLCNILVNPCMTNLEMLTLSEALYTRSVAVEHCAIVEEKCNLYRSLHVWILE